jgi:UDP-N-acetylmuramate dehydrogenase
VETRVDLRGLDAFGLPALAAQLVRVTGEADVRRVVDDRTLGAAPKFILGGGSNVVFTRDVPALVLKVEVRGRRLVQARDDAWVVELGAGAAGTRPSAWTLEQGWPGARRPGADPGTVGAAPVQNIGAYGVELARPLRVARRASTCVTGRIVTLDRADCALRLPRQRVQAASSAGRQRDHARAAAACRKPWQPELGYLDLRARGGRDRHRRARRAHRSSAGCAPSAAPSCPTRRVIGNAGSFFENPVVSADAVRATSSGATPRCVQYPLPDGSREAGRRLADRRLRLEGQERGRRRPSTSARPSCSSTAARPPAARW